MEDENEEKDIPRPRGMIAAMERGPGPAKYSLPPMIGFRKQDFSKHRSPAVSVKGRLKFSFVPRSWGPGPAMYFVGGSVSRYGKDEMSEMMIKPKLPPEKDYTNAPGPGTYNPTMYNLRKAPRFSLKGRTSFRRVSDYPASNTYMLPPTIGRNLALYPSTPGPQLYARLPRESFTHDFAETPGPARYSPVSVDLYRSANPNYSINFKLPEHPKPKSPAPNSYRNEEVTIHKPRIPKCTFGIKHSEYLAPVILEIDN